MEQSIVITKGINKREAVLLENNEVVEWFFESNDRPQMVGSVFLGKVERVLPGMEAAFVDIGTGKNGFLHRDELLAFHLDPSDLTEKQTKSISQFVSPGDTIAVQVTKEGTNEKGPRLSGVVSIPGKYVVYMPEGAYVAVSRRIESEHVRASLHTALENKLQHNEGAIVRTAAANAPLEEVERDLVFLRTLWQKTLRHQEQAPALIYRAATLVETLLLGYLNEQVTEVVVDDIDDYRLMKQLVQTDDKDKVKLYAHKGSSFQSARISAQLAKAQKRRIWLKNGAFLVIDETEAMTVIDVNTGKFTGKFAQSETVLAVNKLAAVEAAKQIRLRNCSGIIVIDFIDMQSDSDRLAVQQTMERALKKDRVKTSVRGFTKLGLLEMTRKKTRLSMAKTVTVECKACAGTGAVLAGHGHAFMLERLILEEQAEALVVAVTAELRSLLVGVGDLYKERLESLAGVTLFLVTDNSLPQAKPYSIDFAGSYEEAQKRFDTMAQAID
ncbi:Rne/Rng family ribonuclease [Bacillus sp. FSL K6-6483]|uniref:Ribonuclease G n=1 Tax=Shouchella clausii (strain KSM-K16) TaxID=66692 RepID=Q5WES2_SHOC1|nr:MULTISPECIES: Rne/Rng family ribonuclease [Shouchella]MCM3313333.1 Rne/Rng family ribonuclease [Psychrobacillus sp. MER TA 17]MCM3380386.1 Rne/Rng family ribonuclease [Shouchella rhizosphaerae]PAE82423.1 ribonuclease E/G [Shouchella clausii]BAD65138.1 ribonuclease G [Shouchella clausii KSM-K16]